MEGVELEERVYVHLLGNSEKPGVENNLCLLNGSVGISPYHDDADNSLGLG